MYSLSSKIERFVKIKKLFGCLLALMLCLTGCSSSNDKNEETSSTETKMDAKEHYAKLINNLNKQDYTVNIKYKKTNDKGETELFYDDYSAVATVKVGKEYDEYNVKYTSNLDSASDKDLGEINAKDGKVEATENCPFSTDIIKYSKNYTNTADGTWDEDTTNRTITFKNGNFETTLIYNEKELPVSFTTTVSEDGRTKNKVEEFSY